MALVTVCVPSYKSAAFIGQTLASVATQTFSDFRVQVALEPVEQGATVAAMTDFLADGRFDYYVNRTTHGYALNVRGLLTRVRTPYYVVLPHDDMWHPRHLEVLVERLTARPDASCAYGDMFKFGHYQGIRSFPVADGPLFERLLGFFLEGAEGTPWRSLTRREMLDRPYPDNDWDGFAVECEWSLHLLLRGPALRCPDAVYLKREPADKNETSVSVGWRLRTSDDDLRRALDHHRMSMLALLSAADLPAHEKRLVELAAETALLRRWIVFATDRLDFGPAEESRAASLVKALEEADSAAERQIRCRLSLALSRYHMRRGRHDQGLRLAEAAVADDPDHGDAFVHLAHVYLLHDRVTDALWPMRRAAELMPLAAGMGSLQNSVAAQLSRLGLAQQPA
jgi:hypothetical protein